MRPTLCKWNQIVKLGSIRQKWRWLKNNVPNRQPLFLQTDVDWYLELVPRRETLSDSEVSQVLGGCQLPFVRFTRWNDKRHKPKRSLYEEIRSQKLCGSALHVWSVIHVEQTPGYHPTPKFTPHNYCPTRGLQSVANEQSVIPRRRSSHYKALWVRRLATTHSYLCEPPKNDFHHLITSWGLAEVGTSAASAEVPANRSKPLHPIPGRKRREICRTTNTTKVTRLRLTSCATWSKSGTMAILHPDTKTDLRPKGRGRKLVKGNVDT